MPDARVCLVVEITLMTSLRHVCAGLNCLADSISGKSVCVCARARECAVRECE